MDYKKYSDLQYDSRKVTKDSIFVAIRGIKMDGHDFIEKALELGASLIVLHEEIYQTQKNYYDELFKKHNAQFETCQDGRLKLAEISHEFFGKASEKLGLIGITGTNGKTTVTHLVQDLLDDCAILGTMGLRKSPQDEYQDQGNTTPQNREVHAIIRNIVDENFKYLAMEVSSHALDQYRVACLNFKYTIVTNLTQDHLDYHKTMENYFEAKAKIFSQGTKYAILNMDDEYFEKFKAKALEQKLEVITISTKDESATYFAKDIKFSSAGLTYNLVANNESVKIQTKLNSLFNVYNSLSAIAVANLEGLSLNQISEKFASLNVVPGRFEVVKEVNTPMCIVDYAHSPDGLLNVLQGAKALVEADTKLICVFGCGGDRDITKRPLMGKIAFDHADMLYVTSDNPRSEDPDRIIADILTGLPNLDKAKVIVDRAEAIKAAINDSRPQDIIVIAGKGHENYQILANETIHFDDREEVLKAFKTLA